MTTTPDYTPLIVEPADEYHAKREHYLTSHQLGEFRKCPAIYHRRQLKLAPEAKSDSYLVGAALHTLVLEGREQYDAEYIVGGPINEKTGRPFGKETKTFAAWAEEHGKKVLTESEAMTVEMMAGAIDDHPLANALLSQPAGQAEGVARCEVDGHRCQARIDYFDHEPKQIVDVKTTFDLDAFEDQIRDYGYVHQLAFYAQVLERFRDDLFGILDNDAFIIAVEKREPYRVGVWQVNAYAIGQAVIENERAMRDLKEARRLDHWPTGFERSRVIPCI